MALIAVNINDRTNRKTFETDEAARIFVDLRSRDWILVDDGDSEGVILLKVNQALQRKHRERMKQDRHSANEKVKKNFRLK